MRLESPTPLAGAMALVLTLACGIDEQSLPAAPVPDVGASRPEAVGRDTFTWSVPVWLGPVVNSSARDWRPVESNDGLRLYFHSNRPGFGGFDIWMSRRAGPNCAWEAPVNLGATVNTARDDGDPAFTPDSRVLFFASDGGHGGAGRGDILVSHRADPDDDLAWEAPVNLGGDVNTSAHESNPSYVSSEAGGTLYFERASGTNLVNSDIYRVEVSHRGMLLGPVVLVAELSAPAPTGPHAPTVRADGRELIFWSGGPTGVRPGSVGLADLWVSNRTSVNAPWSAPENIGTPVNSSFADLSATLSHDGQTLYFTSAQQRGGLGLQDMWMSTRGLSGHAARGVATHCGP